MKEINDNENNKATFNVVIAYKQPTKAVVTWYGFNKDQVREEVLEHFDHIPDLKIETIDMVEGIEYNTDNIVSVDFAQNKPELEEV